MKNLVTRFKNYRSIRKSHKTLSGMTDRQLRDIGINPHMIQAGVRAYPWK